MADGSNLSLLGGAGSVLRKPRLKVTAQGQESTGAFECNVQVNNRMQAARFDVSFALYNEKVLNSRWWGDQKDVPISVQVGLEGDDGTTKWTEMLQGTTDHIHYHPINNTLRIEGRDFASRLIDAVTHETFANKRFSEIVAILASRHGMTADVTPTTNLVGQYYQLEHSKITLDGFHKGTKEWDLLVFLAQAEDYDLWVQGTVIHAHPAEAPDTAHPFVVRLTQATETGNPIALENATEITCERSLTLAKDIKVVVKTFSGRHNRSLEGTYPKGGKSSSLGGSSNIQQRVFLRPGLTQAQADKEAERLHKELTQNERVVNVKMPGILELTPRMMVRLEGTNSSWDQNYYVDDLHTHIHWDQGLTQDVRLKNSSPKSDANVG